MVEAQAAVGQTLPDEEEPTGSASQLAEGLCGNLIPSEEVQGSRLYGWLAVSLKRWRWQRSDSLLCLGGEPSPWKKGRVNRWQRRHTVQTRRWSKALKKVLLLRFW